MGLFAKLLTSPHLAWWRSYEYPLIKRFMANFLPVFLQFLLNCHCSMKMRRGLVSDWKFWHYDYVTNIFSSTHERCQSCKMFIVSTQIIFCRVGILHFSEKDTSLILYWRCTHTIFAQLAKIPSKKKNLKWTLWIPWNWFWSSFRTQGQNLESWKWWKWTQFISSFYTFLPTTIRVWSADW